MLEKQVETTCVKRRTSQSFSGAKQWLQKATDGTRLFSGFTWSNFPKQHMGWMLLPICKPSQENELPLLKKARKEKITYFE